jgi:hypothetical protein
MPTRGDGGVRSGPNVVARGTGLAGGAALTEGLGVRKFREGRGAGAPPGALRSPMARRASGERQLGTRSYGAVDQAMMHATARSGT